MMLRFLLILLLAWTGPAIAQVDPDLPPSFPRLSLVHLQSPLAPQHPSARSLEAWWRVLPGRAGGPTWYDLVNKHPGTLTAMTTAGSGWSPTSRPGGQGDLHFDGTDDTVQVSGLLGQPAALTLAAWVSLQTGGSLGSEVISLGDVVSLRLDDSGTAIEAAYYVGASTWNVTTTPVVYAATGWHHFVYVVNPAASSQVIYVDGLPLVSTAFSAAIVYAGLGANTFLGRHGNGAAGYFWVGDLDDARVWTRALTAADVARVYRESRAGEPTLLQRLLPSAIAPPSVASRGRFFPFFSPSGDRK